MGTGSPECAVTKNEGEPSLLKGDKMMHNIKLTLEYDGSRYQGWQRAKGESTNTVSNKL